MTEIEFRGKHFEFLHDNTPELFGEGSLSSGKTTVALWKELEAAKKYPGIWILLTRWTDDAVKTLLRPAFEQLARIHKTEFTWNDKENYYALPNGSRAFAFGLKTQSSDPLQKYAKIRGLPVSRILFDQAEQGPSDVASELRFRLRPDIEARLKGIAYPTQLTFLANPVPEDHFLAREFPVSNKIKGRRHYVFSLHDNAHVLPQTMIDSLLTLYPPEHPKHATMILGQRGLSVVGDAVYENLFDRSVHVKQLSVVNGELVEAFEVGKHNPTWVIGQRSAHGGLSLFGGLMCKRQPLDVLVSTVDQYRSEWFGNVPVLTCTGPMGQVGVGSTDRFTLMSLLRSRGVVARSRDSANAHDVQLALIEEISSRLRRRVSLGEEAITINADPAHWLQMTPDGLIAEKPFLSFAFEGGYTWAERDVSVANKQLRQPRADDEYANAMRCVENLILNFFAGQRTPAEKRATQRRTPRGQPSAGTTLDYMA